VGGSAAAAAAGAAGAAGAAVGVLGLQGSFALHVGALERLGLPARLVKKPDDLEGVRHLILPGGESTVISHFLESTGLGERIARRVRDGGLACLGTCAGAIILGREPEGGETGAGRQPRRLGLADVELRRNAYGRQRESFRRTIRLEDDLATGGGEATEVEGVFIRSPRIVRVGAAARVLGRDGDEPVLVRDGACLLATFHPELAGGAGALRVHAYFVERL